MAERLPTHGETNWDTILEGYLGAEHNPNGTHNFTGTPTGQKFLRDDRVWAVPATGSTINAQSGTTYTLALTDDGVLVKFTSASAVTLTIPTNTSAAFPIGAIISLYQYGAGQVTVSPTGGVTMRSPGSKTKIAQQYGQAALTKIATDEWTLEGNITT